MREEVDGDGDGEVDFATVYEHDEAGNVLRSLGDNDLDGVADDAIAYDYSCF